MVTDGPERGEVLTHRKALGVRDATALINDRTGLGLTERTVREYCRIGLIKALQPKGARGRYRIAAVELDRFIRLNGGSVDNGV
jgi:Helix-turn-helix domain